MRTQTTMSWRHGRSLGVSGVRLCSLNPTSAIAPVEAKPFAVLANEQRHDYLGTPTVTSST